MQHRSRSNSRDGHSSTHDTREGSSQKRIHGAAINGKSKKTVERVEFLLKTERGYLRDAGVT